MASDPAEALTDFIQSHLADQVNTTLEGVIVAYKAGRVDVKPTGKKAYTDGDLLDFPVIYNLPLQWPCGDGGNAGVKVPIVIGDKCTIHFKQQPQDESDDGNTRRFSLADATVQPGVGYPDSIPGNESLKLYYGEAFIEITKDGKVNVNAPGGFNVNAPNSEFSGQVLIRGLLTFMAGAQAYGDVGSGAVMRVNGQLVVDSDASINGVWFMPHTHTNGNDGNPTGGVIS